jgi:agmatinase
MLMPRYGPVDAQEIPRYSGIRTFARLPHVQDLSDVDVAVIGVPFDSATTFAAGTRFGPASVREMSLMLKTYNAALGVQVYDHLSVVDYGDLATVPGYIDDSFTRITTGIKTVLEAGVIPVVIGGDHSITLPQLRAFHQVRGPVALLQFDAHPDTWDTYFGQKYTHGTPFRRAIEEGLLDMDRSIQVGLRGQLYNADDWEQARRFGFEVWTADDVYSAGIPAVLDAIKQRVGTGPVFLTFDIDVLDPSNAPGTGVLDIGGFTSREAQQMMRGLTGIHFVGMDLTEVLPANDVAGMTSLVGATMIFEFLSLLALRRSQR